MRFRPRFLIALGATVAFAAAPPAAAAVYMTQDKALAAAFPAGISVTREAKFLTADQMARARGLAGAGIPIESAPRSVHTTSTAAAAAKRTARALGPERRPQASAMAAAPRHAATNSTRPLVSSPSPSCQMTVR